MILYVLNKKYVFMDHYQKKSIVCYTPSFFILSDIRINSYTENT